MKISSIGNKFYESSDNIYSSKTKKSNYEDKFSNKHCESVENHWPRNTENAYKTICRDSFYRNQNNFSILLENSTNKSSSNDFICGEKLKSLRLDPSPSVSSMDVPSYRTPAPAPPSSKPVLTTGTLSKSVFQNGPYKKAECNLTISLKVSILIEDSIVLLVLIILCSTNKCILLAGFSTLES